MKQPGNFAFKHKELSLVPGTHAKNLAMVAGACDPTWEVRQVDCWGTLASQSTYWVPGQ